MAHSPLSEAHKAALRSCRVKLEESLDVDYILARCLQDDVISQQMKENIEAKSTRNQKCSAFLDILLTRGQQAFNNFIAALSVNYSFLSVPLERELRVKALSIAKASLVHANEIMVDRKEADEEEVEISRASVENIKKLMIQLRKTLGMPTSTVSGKGKIMRSSSMNKLSDAHKAALRSSRIDIEESLEVQDILPRCIQDGMITQRMKATVLAHPTRHERCSAFLDILETRGKKAFDIFVSALHDDYHFLKLPLKRELRIQALAIATDDLTNAISIFVGEVPSNEKQSTKEALESIETLISQLKETLWIKEEFVDSTTSASSEPPDNVTAQMPPSSDSPSVLQNPPTAGPSLVVKSQLEMQQPSTSHESTPSTSLVKQLKTLKLSSGHLSLTLARKIELSYSCFGLCSSPMGDIITSIDEHGIFVYNKDYTFKLKFALERQNDVVCLPTDEIVISSWRNNYVKVFDMEGNYKRQICKDVNRPHGLAFHPQLGVVVIGYNPLCLNICSISGQVLRTITNASFNNLYRVAINPYNKTLLVTDYNTNTLHCLDWEGNEVFAYKGDGDDGLDKPEGICCTEKHLLLVDSENHRVLILSHDGDLLKVLLTKEDGLLFPSEVMVDSSGNIVVGESHTAKTRKNLLYVYKIDD